MRCLFLGHAFEAVYPELPARPISPLGIFLAMWSQEGREQCRRCGLRGAGCASVGETLGRLGSAYLAEHPEGFYYSPGGAAM